MTTIDEQVVLYRLFRQAGNSPSPNDLATDLFGKTDSCVVYPTSQEIMDHPFFSDVEAQRIYILRYDAHLAIPPEELHHESSYEKIEAHQKRLERRLQDIRGVAEVLSFHLPSHDQITRWRAYPRGEGVGKAIACLTRYQHIVPALYVVAAASIVYHSLIKIQAPADVAGKRATNKAATTGAMKPAQVIPITSKARPRGDIDDVLDRIFDSRQPPQLATVLQIGSRNTKNADSSDRLPFNRKPDSDIPPEPDNVA